MAQKGEMMNNKAEKKYKELLDSQGIEWLCPQTERNCQMRKNNWRFETDETFKLKNTTYTPPPQNSRIRNKCKATYPFTLRLTETEGKLVEYLKDKRKISHIEIFRQGLSLYSKAEFKPLKVPAKIIAKAKGIVR